MLTSKICHKSSNFSTCSRIFWTETKWQECEQIGDEVDEGWAHGLSCVETHPACRRGAPCRCCCSTKDPGWPGTWHPGEPPPPAGCWGWFAAHPPRASSFCRRRLDRWGGNRRRPSRLHFRNIPPAFVFLHVKLLLKFVKRVVRSVFKGSVYPNKTHISSGISSCRCCDIDIHKLGVRALFCCEDGEILLDPFLQR